MPARPTEALGGGVGGWVGGTFKVFKESGKSTADQVRASS